jgi:hypothetical protein
MYIYTFLRRMTDTMTSQFADLSSWDILYTVDTERAFNLPTKAKRRDHKQILLNRQFAISYVKFNCYIPDA